MKMGGRARMAGRPGRLMLLLRRFSQTMFFALFLVLFVKTDYNGTDRLEAAVNLLFRLDPYLAAGVMLGVKAIFLLFLPSLVVLLLTLILGRAFCGWFCPMGTLLDLCRKAIPPRDQINRTVFPGLPLTLLVFTLFASVFGLAVVGLVDPFSLLVRGMAQALYPMLNHLTVGFFTFTYGQLPEFVNRFTEPVYGLLQASVLPAGQKYFHLASLSFFFLLGIVLLERVQRRFFCRNICPLGAMLGLIGARSPVAGQGGNDDCGSCHLCSSYCRMGAIDGERSIAMDRCNLCFECVRNCPRKIISFGFSGPWPRAAALSLSRRQFIGAAVAGFVLPSVKGVEALAKNPDPLLIRPPGALAEKEFLQRCVRCAECIQVCLGNALQPAFLQAGLDGVFTPLLVARSGYCEFNCTLCGQVCPSGALRVLTLEGKQRLKIGHAWFDRNICLPYAKGIPCMVCEEHCPTPEKAIRFREATLENPAGQPVTVQQPYVVDDLCIGCGICETKCPLPGRSAIFVTSGGEARHPERSLPMAPMNYS